MGEYEWAATELATRVRKGGRWAAWASSEERKRRKAFAPGYWFLTGQQHWRASDRCSRSTSVVLVSPPAHVTRSFHERTAPIASFPFPAIMPTWKGGSGVMPWAPEVRNSTK